MQNPSSPSSQTHNTIGSIMTALRRPSKRNTVVLGQRAEAISKQNRNRFVISRSRRAYCGGALAVSQQYPLPVLGRHARASGDTTATTICTNGSYVYSTNNREIPIIVELVDDDGEDESDCSMSDCLTACSTTPAVNDATISSTKLLPRSVEIIESEVDQIDSPPNDNAPMSFFSSPLFCSIFHR